MSLVLSQLLQIYKKQTWQNGKPVYSYLTLHLLMTPPQLGHLTSINSMMSTFLSPLTKIGMMANLQFY